MTIIKIQPDRLTSRPSDMGSPQEPARGLSLRMRAGSRMGLSCWLRRACGLARWDDLSTVERAMAAALLQASNPTARRLG